MSKILTIQKDNSPIYDIVIENNFDSLSDRLSKLGYDDRRVCIVSDSTVAPIYMQQVKNEISKINNKIYEFVFEAGEANKNLYVVKDLYEYLILNHFERRDILIALGGGVVGDLTGYAAATYLRGISFVQVPTTLLAQVDSSIGGKTGVDFDAYKNMVGAFHQPALVYINTSTLSTLSVRIFNSGFGEIIKHGYIKDASYLEFLKDNFDKIKSLEPNVLEAMIYRNCEIKGDVVEKDPTEKGERALLNFGHTLGHAIERLADFKLYHGECVVLGMICAMNISLKRGLISQKEYDEALELFSKYDYSLTVSGIKAEDVIEVSKTDKKMENGQIKFILLKEVGCAYIDKTITEQEMYDSLSTVLR